jgi:photosystem II stability/assembly factor-like uncharacterized protein
MLMRWRNRPVRHSAVMAAVMTVWVFAVLPPSGATHDSTDDRTERSPVAAAVARQRGPAGLLADGDLEHHAYLPLALRLGQAEPAAPAQRWVESNRGLTSWSIVGMAVDYEDPTIIYALTRSRGLYHSPDAGRTWLAANEGLPTSHVVSMGYTHGNLLTMDPNHADVLYTNINGRAYKYRAGDGWMDIGQGIDVCDGNGVVGIVVDPQDSRHIFAAHIASGCPGGIYESRDADRDAALTWTQIASWTGSGELENDAWTLAIDPTDPSRLYSAPPYLGFLYSTDGGHHWRRATPLGDGRRAGNVVVVHPTLTNRVILGHPHGVHVGESAVTGDELRWTWTDHTDVVRGNVWDIDIAPSDPDNVLVASTAGLFGSHDGGGTWEAIGDHAALFPKSLAIDPSDPEHVYLGSGNGVFRSMDGGRHLTESTGVIPAEMEVLATAISDSDPRIYYCSLYGVAFCRSDDRGATWQCRSNLPGVTRTIALEVDPLHADVVYAGYEQVYRSENGGRSWSLALDPGPDREIHDLATSPDGTLYAAVIRMVSADERYAELYRSSDGGVTWEGPNGSFEHRALTVGPIVFAADGTIYVASYDFVRRSSDGGVTWQRLTVGLTGHPDDRWVDGLAVDPVDPRRLYLVARSHRLHGSTDGGSTWSLLDAAAPAYPGRVIIDHSDRSVTYVFGLHGWRRYTAFGTIQQDMTTEGIEAPYANLRRTALQDPLDAGRFVTGDPFAGFLAIDLTDGSGRASVAGSSRIGLLPVFSARGWSNADNARPAIWRPRWPNLSAAKP